MQVDHVLLAFLSLPCFPSHLWSVITGPLSMTSPSRLPSRSQSPNLHLLASPHCFRSPRSSSLGFKSSLMARRAVFHLFGLSFSASQTRSSLLQGLRTRTYPRKTHHLLVPFPPHPPTADRSPRWPPLLYPTFPASPQSTSPDSRRQLPPHRTLAPTPSCKRKSPARLRARRTSDGVFSRGNCPPKIHRPIPSLATRPHGQHPILDVQTGHYPRPPAPR